MLTSRHNPKIKTIRSLRQRKYRQETGLFIVEGIRHVGEAVESGAEIDSLVFSEDLLTSDYADTLLREQEQAGTSCLSVSAEVFKSIAQKEGPQGILAVVRQPQTNLEELHTSKTKLVVALVEPRDPGNIGTVLRTIDAVGGSGLILIGESADPYHNTAVRASMGAVFLTPIVQTSFRALRDWAVSHGYYIYGTSSQSQLDYSAVDHYEAPAILLFGSERQGLSSAQMEICEQVVRIPMHGKVTSLNLAVAVGILLYEIHQKII